MSVGVIENGGEQRQKWLETGDLALKALSAWIRKLRAAVRFGCNVEKLTDRHSLDRPLRLAHATYIILLSSTPPSTVRPASNDRSGHHAHIRHQGYQGTRRQARGAQSVGRGHPTGNARSADEGGARRSGSARISSSSGVYLCRLWRRADRTRRKRKLRGTICMG